MRLFWIFICICVGLQGHLNASPVRDNIQKVFLAEVGTKEATGKNDGERVESYLKTCGLKKGNPWCAAFVNWCFRAAGIVLKITNPAYSPNWFPKDKLTYIRGKNLPFEVKKGDCVGYYFAEHKRIAHIGFVDEWNDKYVITVEGNTSNSLNRDGDGVFRNKRTKRSIYCVSNWIDKF